MRCFVAFRTSAATITFATFTPDDARVATTGYDGYARIWDVATGVLVRSFRGSGSLLWHALRRAR